MLSSLTPINEILYVFNYDSSLRQRINKYRTRPIYGVLVHNPPYFRMHEKIDKNKAYAEVARWYQTPIKSEPSRKIAALRMAGSGVGGGTGGRRGLAVESGGGGGSSSPIPSMGFPPQQGSFQHLKVSTFFFSIQLQSLEDISF